MRDRMGASTPADFFDSLVRADHHVSAGLTATATGCQLGLAPGRMTEVIGIVDLDKSVRDYRSMVPVFGCFVDNDAATPIAMIEPRAARRRSQTGTHG